METFAIKSTATQVANRWHRRYMKHQRVDPWHEENSPLQVRSALYVKGKMNRPRTIQEDSNTYGLDWTSFTTTQRSRTDAAL